jgi:hypothetical protein
MDVAAHPQWNPFVRAIVGIPAIGERLTVTRQTERGRAMTIRPPVPRNL